MSTILTGRGMDWQDMYDVLGQIRTKLAGVCAKLDDDATVTDTDYESAIVTFTFPPAASGREPANGITAQALRHQGLVLDYLKTVRTQFNALNAKLDADNGAVTTYSAQDMSSIIDTQNGGLIQSGMFEGALAYWLYTYMTKFNAVLAALDADGNVADTDYASLWAFNITAYVDPQGTFASV